jgi:Tripartite tricarboxylate transporter TctB family
MTPLIVAALLLVLCAVAAWQVTVIPTSMMEMAVGATLAPAVIVGALSVVAVLYGISAWRGRQVDTSHEPDQSPLPGAGVRLASLLGAGVVFMALVVPLGFVVPATLAGMGVARAFDAPLGIKSAAVCGGIALVFWLVFARLLGVGLGPAVAWAF